MPTPEKLRQISIRIAEKMWHSINELAKARGIDFAAAAREYFDVADLVLSRRSSHGHRERWGRLLSELNGIPPLLEEVEEYENLLYKIAEKSSPKQHAENICKLVARLLKRFREDLTDRVNSAKMEASSALPLLKLNREDCTELHRQIEKTAGAALSEDRRQRLIALAKVVVEMGAS